MKTLLKTFIVFTVLISHSVKANDSIASLGMGGLELQKTEEIEMVSEVLEISTSKIKVIYHFLNTSDKDITATVAFPMPAKLVSEDVYDNRVPGPVESFRTFAEGKPVSFHKHQLLLINDADMTDQLRKIGLSDKQIFGGDGMCVRNFDYEECGLSKKQIAAVKKMLGHKDTQRWWMAIKDVPYWEQVFPAGKEIEVIHEYKPFVGEKMGAGFDAPSQVDKACLDERTRKAIHKRAMGEGDRSVEYFMVYTVSYILGTARNWKGSIKDFKLILKKEVPGVFVSLCFPGAPVKTSPTTIEFTQKNFVPQDQMTVFFYDIRLNNN